MSKLITNQVTEMELPTVPLLEVPEIPEVVVTEIEIAQAIEPKKITEIKNLSEKKLVEYANSLGIPATTKDKKATTLEKVLNFFNNLIK